MRSGTSRPTLELSSSTSRPPGDSTGSPSNSSSTSPTSSPAASAGLPLDTLAMSSASRSMSIARPCGRAGGRADPPRPGSLVAACRARPARAAVFHAIAAGMTTLRPRIAAAVLTPIKLPAHVNERAAGEAVVHRRRRADDLIDLAAAPGRQRPANHGHEPGARRDRVAPRARDREREMPDARRRRRDRDRRRVEPARAQHDEAARRIPSAELRVERAAVGGRDAHAVLAAERPRGREHHARRVDDAAHRPAPALHLHDRRRHGGDGIGQLIRKR